ncbi:MerR family transcriptional regulator [Saccharibacillus sp. CPCC 101409]|uniref:MerR family transcriptional regulator n=1 Tax=Saccharibacillus sp. CPCC 101409 TaxID=3058041 RepID=UPI002673D89D|nr:MerR family transcriptional regulator [Saccharibacillus sp. CPCC 101409]MDO3413014.1 MerR family transcriptional regulator [Saccharibacillus sp. CPCC 101409]
MNGYTARQIAELLQKDDPRMNLRTIRYYTQIGMVPPLELSGNKRVYGERHLHWFRAILTLSRTGETLSAIQDKLRHLTPEEIEKIGSQLPLYESSRILENETLRITDDVAMTISPRISAETKQKMIESVSRLLEEGDR